MMRTMHQQDELLGSFLAYFADVGAHAVKFGQAFSMFPSDGILLWVCYPSGPYQFSSLPQQAGRCPYQSKPFRPLAIGVPKPMGLCQHFRPLEGFVHCKTKRHWTSIQDDQGAGRLPEVCAAAVPRCLPANCRLETCSGCCNFPATRLSTDPTLWGQRECLQQCSQNSPFPKILQTIHSGQLKISPFQLMLISRIPLQRRLLCIKGKLPFCRCASLCHNPLIVSSRFCFFLILG